MREVDDVHHAPDQREARGEQRVDGAQQKTADNHLNEDKGHGARFTFSVSREWSRNETSMAMEKGGKLIPPLTYHQPL
jgi:hypothetical protein